MNGDVEKKDACCAVSSEEAQQTFLPAWDRLSGLEYDLGH
jgi:hypothetical protein